MKDAMSVRVSRDSQRIAAKDHRTSSWVRGIGWFDMGIPSV
jgi:hypothetical protein